jgi:hypothetical protein
MSHELHLLRSDGRRKTVVERFKLSTPEWEALVTALIRAGVKTATIADLVGCSQSHVYKVAQAGEMGSESPETRAESSTGELPLASGCLPCVGRGLEDDSGALSRLKRCGEDFRLLRRWLRV